MNRLFAAWLVAVLVAAGCSPGTRWVGEEIDGFIVSGDRPCAMPPGDDCAPQLEVALAQLTPEERSAVSAAALGMEPDSYEDDSGERIYVARAGLTHGYGVILDIAGKPRRVIPLVCGWLSGPQEPGSSACEYSPDSLPRAH